MYTILNAFGYAKEAAFKNFLEKKLSTTGIKNE